MIIFGGKSHQIPEKRISGKITTAISHGILKEAAEIAVDPDDNRILQGAANAKADYVVSEDNNLS